MKTYVPKTGENISTSAANMVALANESKQTVKGEFNALPLTVNVGDTADAVVQYYNDERNRRGEEYRNSPEYKQAQDEAVQAANRRQQLLEGALLVSPEKMTIRDEVAYKKAVDVNGDTLVGKVILEFSDRWARIMEGRISNGGTLEECAREASYLADNEGRLSGFTYNLAVSFLVDVWIHGEALRRWHNSSFGKTGEKANEEGAVVNGAMLVVKSK